MLIVVNLGIYHAGWWLIIQQRWWLILSFRIGISRDIFPNFMIGCVKKLGFHARPQCHFSRENYDQPVNLGIPYFQTKPTVIYQLRYGTPMVSRLDNWDECRTTIKQNDFTYQKRCCKSKMTNNNLKSKTWFDGIWWDINACDVMWCDVKDNSCHTSSRRARSGMKWKEQVGTWAPGISLFTAIEVVDDVINEAGNTGLLRVFFGFWVAFSRFWWGQVPFFNCWCEIQKRFSCSFLSWSKRPQFQPRIQ